MAPIRFGIHVCSISCANMRVRRGAATLEVAKLANAALRPVPPLEIEPAGASICNSVTRYGSVGSPQKSVSAVHIFASVSMSSSSVNDQVPSIASRSGAPLMIRARTLKSPATMMLLCRSLKVRSDRSRSEATVQDLGKLFRTTATDSPSSVLCGAEKTDEHKSVGLVREIIDR